MYLDSRDPQFKLMFDTVLDDTTPFAKTLSQLYAVMYIRVAVCSLLFLLLFFFILMHKNIIRQFEGGKAYEEEMNKKMAGFKKDVSLI